MSDIQKILHALAVNSMNYEYTYEFRKLLLMLARSLEPVPSCYHKDAVLSALSNSKKEEDEDAE